MTLTAQDRGLATSIETVTRFELAFRAADQATIDELSDPGMLDHNAPDGDPSLAAFKTKAAYFKAIFPDLVEDLQDVVASGDTVATRWVLTGSQQEDFMGIPASGQRIRVEGMNFYRLKDGRVTDLWTQFDGATLMQQLAVVDDQDFRTVLDVTGTPDEVFEALTTTAGVTSWWATAGGNASSGGDLELRFGEHVVRFRVTAADRPTRVSWQTVDCDVLPDWVGTTIVFDLSPTEAGGTTVRFRHAGLVPELPCYDRCSNDWGHFLHSSLVPYVETGIGHPVGS